jgi:hypothetical protein
MQNGVDEEMSDGESFLLEDPSPHNFGCVSCPNLLLINLS